MLIAIFDTRITAQELPPSADLMEPSPTCTGSQNIRAEREQKRLAALPKEHKIILVPADPTYFPTQVELWPILNETIQQVIAGHPEVQK